MNAIRSEVRLLEPPSHIRCPTFSIVSLSSLEAVSASVDDPVCMAEVICEQRPFVFKGFFVSSFASRLKYADSDR